MCLFNLFNVCLLECYYSSYSGFELFRPLAESHLSTVVSAVVSWVWVGVFVTVIALLLLTHRLWELVNVLLALCSHQPFCSLFL